MNNNTYGVPQQNMPIALDTSLNLNIDYWLVVLFWVAVAALALLAIRKIIKFIAKRNAHHDHVVYMIKLPKDKPADSSKEATIQEMREEIAKGETVFASIGGLRADRSLKGWLLGRSDHFGFEIVASKKLISFYVSSPREMARYVEQQIHAYYPEAIMEEMIDYNSFTPKGHILAGYLKTKKSSILPLKTYTKMDVDPMNSIINVISKMGHNESVAIQYLVRSAYGVWHKKAKHFVHKATEKNSVSAALGGGVIIDTLSELASIFEAAKPKTPEDQKNKRTLTAMDQELLKAVEEKNSKAGLDVNLRIVVTAETKEQAKLFLDNIASAYGQYDYYGYGNTLKGVPIKKNQNKIINDFIYRRFDSNISFLLNTEELASMYHFPLKSTETPNIVWLTAKFAAAPTNIPEEGIILGKNVYRGVAKDIRIKRADRRRHTYVIGKSGVGKSQLIANMAIQDVLNGEGVCVIDPHGDLIQDILSRVPPERAEDVVLFAPADTERPLALNLMEFDPKYPEQKTFVINEMIKIFDKLYDLKSTGGPIFEQYMRNAMLLVMSDPESGSTLMEIPKVLADAEFRKMKLEKCSDHTVVEFWRKEAEKAGGDAALANVVPYITSKLTSFISNDMMRPIIGQQKSAFNFRDVMDKRKILLVDLTKGLIGEMNSYLLGMIIVGKILMAALSRADMKAEDRKDFYLYIDEFQNFTTDSISAILSEARKYGLNLIIAHQYLGQLSKNNDTSIRDAVFGNVGTWLLFKVGSDDAETMEKEYAPTFNKFDLINIEAYTTYVKLLIDNTASRPFSMSTPWPLFGVKRDEIVGKIKTLSRLKYGQDRNIIEAEIRRRTQGL